MKLRFYVDKVEAKMALYSRSHSFRSHARLFRELWGELDAEAIDGDLIDGWSLRRRRERAPATVAKELSFLRAVFRVMKRPWPREDLTPLRIDNFRCPMLSPEKEAEFKARMRPQDFDIVRLFILTGLRRVELFRLRAEDVCEVTKSIQIVTSKTGKGCWHPISEEALEILQRAIRQLPKGEGFLFPWRGPQHDNRYEVGQRWYRRRWRPVSDAIMGKSRLTIHGLRHVFCTRLVLATKDLYLVQRAARHESPEITAKRYCHLAADRLREGLSQLSTGSF